jgi:hypothetical protein
MVLVVYVTWHSRPGGEDNNNTASVIGVMQALISVFIDDGDKIRCVNAGRTRITFLLRSPLYYVCVSSWGEPESTVWGSQSGPSVLLLIDPMVHDPFVKEDKGTS